MEGFGGVRFAMIRMGKQGRARRNGMSKPSERFQPEGSQTCGRLAWEYELVKCFAGNGGNSGVGGAGDGMNGISLVP
jgi:hypothetical protein